MPFPHVKTHFRQRKADLIFCYRQTIFERVQNTATQYSFNQHKTCLLVHWKKWLEMTTKNSLYSRGIGNVQENNNLNSTSSRTLLKTKTRNEIAFSIRIRTDKKKRKAWQVFSPFISVTCSCWSFKVCYSEMNKL